MYRNLFIQYSLIALACFSLHAEDVKMRQASSENVRHSFLICGGTTAIIDEDSKVVWSTKDRSRDGYVLDNGNILYSTGRIAKEVTRDNKVVWQYELSAENKSKKGELGTAQRLDNGNTLVVERGVKPQLLEITPKGEVAVRVPLQPETKNAHMQTRMARKLPNGNYIVPHLLAFAIKEYSPTGEIVRTIKTDLPELGGRKARNWPFTAILLPNGNFLANLTNGNKTVEFTPEGKVVWKVANEDIKANHFKDPCGGQRLPNGNTVIASYGCKGEGVKMFEVTPDKKVVWTFHNPKVKVHGLQVLSTNGKPLSNTLMK